MNIDFRDPAPTISGRVSNIQSSFEVFKTISDTATSKNGRSERNSRKRLHPFCFLWGFTFPLLSLLSTVRIILDLYPGQKNSRFFKPPAQVLPHHRPKHCMRSLTALSQVSSHRIASHRILHHSRQKYKATSFDRVSLHGTVHVLFNH